jgi:uncharacterized protein
MRRVTATAICCVGLLLAHAGQARAFDTSFNCRIADRPDEVLICQSRELAALDRRMSSLYFELRNRLYGRRVATLADDQARWLRTRFRCGRDYDCIENAYRSRIRELREDY